MREVQGNIWDYYEQGHWIVIPTNGFIKKNGKAVMGRGLAKQASEKFQNLSDRLGHCLREEGNWPVAFITERLFSFPVKHNWWERADLLLIRQSAVSLEKIVETLVEFNFDVNSIYIPHVGCGNGKLNWKDVRPILEETLNKEYFVICDNNA